MNVMKLPPKKYVGEEKKSLYEYLGKPAGSSLGKSVADEAVRQNVSIDKKTITNPKYSGDILMYPVTFLNEYFKQDELPF